MLFKHFPAKEVNSTSRLNKHYNLFFKTAKSKNSLIKAILHKQKLGSLVLCPGYSNTWIATHDSNQSLLFTSNLSIESNRDKANNKSIKSAMVAVHLEKKFSVIHSIHEINFPNIILILSGYDIKGKPVVESWSIKKDKIWESIAIPKNMVSINYVKPGYRHIGISGIDSDGNIILALAGKNDLGQLGNGSNNQQWVFKPVTLPKDMEYADSIELGLYHTFILGRNKSGHKVVASTGSNYHGQLGTGDNKNRNVFKLIDLPSNLKTLDSVVVKEFHTFLIGKDKNGFVAIAVAGGNRYGQLGTGDTLNKEKFTPVDLPVRMKSVELFETEDSHTVFSGRDEFGKLIMLVTGCFAFGMLGFKDKEGKTKFAKVKLPTDMKTLESIQFGRCHTLLLGRDEKWKPILATAGWNKYGQLGTGDIQDRTTFTPITLPENMIDVDFIRANEMQSFIIGRDQDGAIMVAAFGDNFDNKLGILDGLKIKIPTLISRPKKPDVNNGDIPNTPSPNV